MGKILFITIIVLIANITTVFALKTGIYRHDFSADGKTLATTNYSGEVSIWDLQTAKELNYFNLRIEEMPLLKFLPDGKTLVAIDEIEDLLIFVKTESGKEVKRLQFKGVYEIKDIFFSQDSQTMWLISKDSYNSPQEAWIVDLQNNRLKNEKATKGQNFIANSHKDLLAYISVEDKKIHIISAQNGQELRSIPMDKDIAGEEKSSKFAEGLQMQFSSDGSKIILHRKISPPKKDWADNPTDLIDEFISYSTANGQPLKKQQVAVNKENGQRFEGEPIININPSGTKIHLLEISSRDEDYTKQFTTFDINSLQKEKEIIYPNEKCDWFASSPDGKYFLTADKTGKIKVWLNETQKQVSELFSNSGGFEKIAISQDGTKYSAVSRNGLIKIWSSNGQELQKIQTELPKAEFIEFSPNGQNLLTVHTTSIEKNDEDKNLTTFKIWDVATGKIIQEFNNSFSLDKIPQGFVFFTKQGDRILTQCGGEENKTVNFCSWNVATGEMVGRSFPITGYSTSYYWLPDNQPISFGQSNQKKIDPQTPIDERNYFLWNFANEKLLKQATEETDIIESFPKDQAGTLIVLDSFQNANGLARVLRVNSGDGLKLDSNQIFDYFTSQNQLLGARFITKPEEKSPTENNSSLSLDNQVLPVPVSKNPDTLVISSDIRVEIKDTIELKKFDGEESETILLGHTDDLIDFVFTPNGLRGISSSYDRTIRVWDVTTGKELFQLK